MGYYEEGELRRRAHLHTTRANPTDHAYNNKMVAYLDMAGKMHTPKAGNKNIDVPLVQMNALLGLFSDSLLVSILGLELDDETKARTLHAFNKLLWIQNDLIGRHYQRTSRDES